MSILYTDEQQAISQEAAKIVAAQSDQARLLGYLEASGEWDAGLWRAAAEQGWTAIGIPEAAGGIGLGAIEQGLVAQACGALPSGCPLFAAHFAVVDALLQAEAAAVRDDLLPGLAEGRTRCAIAFGEGFEPLPANPSAVVSAGRLSGAKDAVAGGLIADIALVLARRDDQPVLAVVELDDASRTSLDTFDNSRLTADVAFADIPCRVIAAGRQAASIARTALARAALIAAHEQLGGAEALLTIARDYALTRKAFGQPIGAFQSIKHRIAELYGLVEIARANCIHAASREGRDDFVTAAAAARLSATEAYDTAARETIQIHGGIGVTWETGLHLHMRRARSLAVEQGNAMFWEDLLVDQLAGEPA